MCPLQTRLEAYSIMLKKVNIRINKLWLLVPSLINCMAPLFPTGALGLTTV